MQENYGLADYTEGQYRRIEAVKPPKLQIKVDKHKKAPEIPGPQELLKDVDVKCPVCEAPLRVESLVTPRTKVNYLMAVCPMLPGHYRVFIKGFYSPRQWIQPLSCPVCNYILDYEECQKANGRGYYKLSCGNTCSKGFSFAYALKGMIDKLNDDESHDNPSKSPKYR